MYTPIVLDKTRNLRYGMKALSIIEKKFKKNLATIDYANLTIEETMTIVWAGLVHEDKELTVDKLIDIIDENNIKLDEIIEVMGNAMDEAFGKTEDEVNPTIATVEQEIF